MDDQNKKNGYDEFFQDRSNEENRDQDHSFKEQEVKPDQTAPSSETEKSSYYYSYGPFKSTGDSVAEPHDGAQADPYAAGRQDGEHSSVEVTPPQQIRQFAPSQSASRSGWQVKEARRSTFKAMFASFLAGVVVVGSLMFVSDKQNWFTSDQATVTQSSPDQAKTAVGSAGDNGSVSTAADVVRPNNIAQLFEKASPAVVKIETFTKQRASSQSGSGMDFFSQFFGDDLGGEGGSQDQGNGSNSNQNQGSTELTPEGIGTGFFFDSSGYILTNQHVVGDADEIQVTVQGYNKPLVAKKLGTSYSLDLAVLKVEGTNFPTLPIGSSEKINIGDWVVAIGNPYGFDHTVTVGVLSSKERPITIPDEQGTRQYEHLLQTDASINPGNSGGPLLNMAGEVIGINTAVSSQAQGIGFAIPTSTIQEVLQDLKANKEIPKKPVPFIGANLAEITDDIAKELGLTSKEGSIVSSVLYKSPAYMADLRQYDVIMGLDGTKYNSREDLIAAIQKKNVDDTVTLNIVRNGEKMDLKVKVGNKNEFEQQQ
ncbi:S1C family serine protease [Paenibacillus sp. OV219]|uniref:S1C family serine protease n=1 Tax=Paenibacillus sp. OV219 TaxID=1884377 RepID=UPI0008D45C4B|nr:trypsin-like peptidase domain-containing protein [Paenibacillus sp. OV219]SEO20588.1 serine protease, S1-C subfamily, contains C-terminal PDZ domain [Paenibacillus sp. OV219]